MRFLVSTLTAIFLYHALRAEKKPEQKSSAEYSKKIELIAQEAEQLLKGSIESYDLMRKECHSLAQFLFTVTTASIGLVGVLVRSDNVCVAVGFAAVALLAGFATGKIVIALQTKKIQLCGNTAINMYNLTDESAETMKLREALSWDERTIANQKKIIKLSRRLDTTRRHLLMLPLFFAAGTLGSWLIKEYWYGYLEILTWLAAFAGVLLAGSVALMGGAEEEVVCLTTHAETD